MVVQIGVVLRLHLRRLWAHRLRTGLAIVAVAAGTSLAVGVAVVLSSADASLAAFGRSIAGPAPLRVVGATAAGGLPPAAVQAAAATPGVVAAVPVVQASSVVGVGHQGRADVVVLGAGCDAARLLHLAGCTAGTAGPSSLFVSASLVAAVGHSAWLQTDQGVVPLAHAVPLAGLDQVASGDVILTGLARAQAMFDRGDRSDVAYLRLQPGTDAAAVARRVAGRVGPAYGVLRQDQPPPALGLATAVFVPLLVLVAVIAAAIAAVLVYDVVALSLEERRRQQAVVAALGAPPWLLAAGPAAEAGAIGVVGGLLGVAGGAAVAGPVLAPLSLFTESLFGTGLSVHVTGGDVALGAAMGLAVGLLAAVRPVRRLQRLDVAGELAGRRRRTEASAGAAWWRVSAGVAAALAGAGLAYAGSRHGALARWQLPAALAGFVLAVAGAAVVVGAGAVLPLAAAARRGGEPRRRTAEPPGPGTHAGPIPRASAGSRRRATSAGSGQRAAGAGRTRRATSAGSSGRRSLPVAVRLGLATAAREPARVGIMAVAVAAAVGVGTVTGGYAAGLSAHVGAGSTGGRAVVVSTVAGTTGDNADAHVPAAVLALLAAQPDVASVSRSVSVLSGGTAAHLVLVSAADSPAGGPPLVAGSARPGPFRRGAVMVGAGLARARGLRPGGIVRVDTPTGVRVLSVEGVWNDGAVGGDTVTMTLAELQRLFGPQLPLGVEVLPAHGIAGATVLRHLRALPLPPDVTVQLVGSYRRQQASQLTAQLAPFWTLERALLVVAFVGVLATLLLAGVGRRREVALLGAVGMAPGGVASLVVSEAVTVALVGAAGGVALGTAVLGVLLMVAPLQVGFTVPFRFDAVVLGSVVPVALVLSAAAAVLPAWRAARAAPVDGLRQD